MTTTTKFIWIGMATALLAAPCFPQADENKPGEPTKYFRLEFTVKELEGGKVVNSRNYTTSLSTQRVDTGMIRAGDKVPVQNGKEQFTYLDVGVNIDCNSLKQVDNQLALHISAD